MSDFKNTGTAWKTRSGALVRLREDKDPYATYTFDWHCEGCTEKLRNALSKDLASRAAQDHAASCSAIQA